MAPAAPGAPAATAGPRKGPRWPWLDRARLLVQAAVFAGFFVQAILYHVWNVRPLGNLLPFVAYESLGRTVVSSALLAWGAIFLLTAIFGRFVCGWICPLGFMQEAGERLLRALGAKLPPPTSQPRFARAILAGVVLAHFAVLPLLASPVRVWQLDLHLREPWLLGFPFRAGLFALDMALLFAILGVAMPLVFGPRPYCKLVCETGWLLDRASAHAFGRIRRDEGFDRDVCIGCKKCATACPQGIQVFEEVHLFDRVVNTDCISCLRCVDACPVDVIAYSARKRVRDTGRAAGYLAALRARTEDLPRHALTGAGAAAGGFAGLILLPPSYFHTYVILATLGGLAGFLLWRGLRSALGEALSEEGIAEAARTQVEREKAAGLAPLSNKEKARLGPARASRSWMLPAVALSLGAIALVIVAVARAVPSRIAMLAEIPQARLDPSARAAEGIVLFGVAPIVAADDLESSFAPLAPWLSRSVGKDVRLVTSRSYGDVAAAVGAGRLDAALLPPGAYASLLRRKVPVRAIASGRAEDGRATYSALIVSRAGGPASLEDLRGGRVAFTGIESLSGWIAPWALLRAAGVARGDLGESVLAGNHSAALALLSAGEVDAAATYDGALASFRARRPELSLRVVAERKGLPYDVVVGRPGLPDALAGALREALLGVTRLASVEGRPGERTASPAPPGGEGGGGTPSAKIGEAPPPEIAAGPPSEDTSAPAPAKPVVVPPAGSSAPTSGGGPAASEVHEDATRARAGLARVGVASFGLPEEDAVAEVGKLIAED